MVDPRRSHRLPLLLLLAAGLATGAAWRLGLRLERRRGQHQDRQRQELRLRRRRRRQGQGGDQPRRRHAGVRPLHAGARRRHARPRHQRRQRRRDLQCRRLRLRRHEARPDTSKFQEANDACKDLLGDAGPMNMSPEQQQEMQDQALAFSKCMREHGVNMPDPTFGGEGRMMMKIGPDDGHRPRPTPSSRTPSRPAGRPSARPAPRAAPALSVSGGKVDGATARAARS